MSKLNKFFIVFFLCFILLTSCTLAADITNLTATNENEASTSEDLPSAEDRVNEENASTQNDLLNGVVNSDSNESSTESPKISSITQATSIPEANLRLSNILSFILISIGIVLILLAIAILIKLNK